MVSLQRASGPTALLDVAFLKGGMLNVFELMRIRRLLRRGRGSDARERAESFVQNTKRARARSEHGNAMSHTQRCIAAGELLYQLGGCSEALELCVLPAAEEMVRDGDYAGAGMVLQDVLDAEPDCARAQSLRGRIPSEYL
ncbi:MAG: hypothetical protein JRG76_10235 [Deltaproteobacteria bacterium]|nr:hypothetical protein [Deltaproteobacteria bacterium]MBW2414874.1 hypothetical protein [Deltaproteobacteria bacterium]